MFGYAHRYAPLYCWCYILCTCNFHSFADSINTFIEGPLDGIRLGRYIVGWGETFDLSFDIKIDHWIADAKTCYGIIHFEDYHLYPGAYYCSKQTEGSIAFETEKVDHESIKGVFKKDYHVFKELNKVYHVQLKQFRQRHVSTKLKRFVKVDGKLVDDYEIEDQPISGEIGFYVGAGPGNLEKSGAHIYNLKVTE